MPSKNKFSVHGEEIHISRDSWNKLASTTYREDYFQEITSVTWTEDKGYLKNGKFGLLHRYIMKKWYGEEVIQAMDVKGWIVDHMNNDGFDCRISNLEFLATRHNVAKGQTVDVESEKMRYHIALNMFKDFTTGLYQISIGFNDLVYLLNEKENTYQPINTLYLLYDCDYRIVINDAEQILLDYDLYKKVNLSKLQCLEYECKFPPTIEITEEEKNGACVERDGEIYMIIGNGKTFIHSAHYKKGWKPYQLNQ